MGLHPKERHLALPASGRLGRERLTVTNALDYNITELILSVKRFIGQVPGILNGCDKGASSHLNVPLLYLSGRFWKQPFS